MPLLPCSTSKAIPSFWPAAPRKHVSPAGSRATPPRVGFTPNTRFFPAPPIPASVVSAEAPKVGRKKSNASSLVHSVPPLIWRRLDPLPSTLTATSSTPTAAPGALPSRRRTLRYDWPFAGSSPKVCACPLTFDQPPNSARKVGRLPPWMHLNVRTMKTP